MLMILALLNPIWVVIPSGGYGPLIIGNLLAGLIEYGVLRWRFGLTGWRWLPVLVIANLASAAIGGYPLKAWLPLLNGHLSLDPLAFALVLVVMAAILTFLGALVMEAPAYLILFHRAEVKRRFPWRALLVAHLASWPISLAGTVYLTRTEWDLTLLTRTRRVPVAAMAPERTWVFLNRGGRILRQRLGASTFEDLGLAASDIETLAREPQGWHMEFYAVTDPDHVKSSGRILAPASWRGPEYRDSRYEGIQRIPWVEKYLNISLLHGANFFDEGNAHHPLLDVSKDGMGTITVLKPGAAREELRCFMPLHRAWYGASVALPDGPVLFEMDGWVMLMDPTTRRLAAVGQGRLKMVLLEPNV